MNILKANYVELDKLRTFRKIFSDISERDLEDDKAADGGLDIDQENQ